MSTITHEPEVVTTVDVPTVSDEEAYRREVLLKAAEIIETYGWRSGIEGMRKYGPHCILGAVARAMELSLYPSDVNGLSYGQRRPANLIGVHWQAASRWNDRLDIIPVTTGRLRRKKMEPDVVVTRTLRRLANGASWAAATRP